MKKVLVVIMSLMSILVFNGCGNNNSTLKGYYQSEQTIDGYVVIISVNSDEKSFVQYIEQREVNKGTYDELGQGKYTLNGHNKSLDISLKKDNSFEITLKKLNEGKPIKMKKIDDVPVYYSTEFDDVDKYQKLLNE